MLFASRLLSFRRDFVVFVFHLLLSLHLFFSFFLLFALSVSVLHILCKCTEISLDLSKVNAIMCFGIFGFGVHRFRAIFSGIVVSHFGAFGRALHVWMGSSPLKSTMHIAQCTCTFIVCAFYFVWKKRGAKPECFQRIATFWHVQMHCISSILLPYFR